MKTISDSRFLSGEEKKRLLGVCRNTGYSEDTLLDCWAMGFEIDVIRKVCETCSIVGVSPVMLLELGQRTEKPLKV